MGERAAVVLAADLEARRDAVTVGEHVRLVRQLDQRVGVVPGHGQDAARAVVFERARQQPLAAAGERAGDDVALEAPAAAALEGEIDRPALVDQQPEALPQPRCRRRSRHLSPAPGAP